MKPQSVAVVVSGLATALACACSGADSAGITAQDAGDGSDGAAQLDASTSADAASDGATSNDGSPAVTDAGGASDASGASDGGAGVDAGDAGSMSGDAGAADAGCPDLDGDGYTAASCGGTDCDDADPNVHPGVVEADDWVVDDVATSGQTLFDTELALDATGAPKIAYMIGPNAGPSTLLYTEIRNGVWAQDTVSAVGAAIRNPRLFIDDNGAAHIAYYQSTTNDAGINGGDLTYATNASGAWATTYVSTDRDVRDQPDIFVTAGGTVYISHETAPGGVVSSQLLLSTKPAAGSFTTETVASDGISAQYNALWMSGGALHVLHQSQLTNLADATKPAAAWQDATIFTGVGGKNWPGISMALALDGNADPHLAHWDLGLGSLQHTYLSAGAWHTETMDPAGVAAQKSTAIAISSGYVYATYPYTKPGSFSSSLLYVTNRSGAFRRFNVVDGVDGTIRCHGRIRAAADGSLHVAVETHNSAFNSFKVVHVHRPATDGIDYGCNGE